MQINHFRHLMMSTYRYRPDRRVHINGRCLNDIFSMYRLQVVVLGTVVSNARLIVRRRGR